MKIIKKIISLVCILSMLVLLISTPTVSARTYKDQLKVNTEYWYEIDEYDTHKYYFKINNKTKVEIKFESNIPIDIKIDEHTYGFYSYFKGFYSRKNMNKTLTLNKGKYCIALESYDFGEYKLEVIAKKAKKLKFNKSKLNVKPGVSKKLWLKTVPDKAFSPEITWYSNNEKVATINKKGEVIAKGLGKTTIVAKAKNGKRAKCTVIVNDKKIFRMHKGTTFDLPKINGKIQKGWKSKDTSIAVSNSTVTGKERGKTIVYKKINGVTYSRTVIVTDPYVLLSEGKENIKNNLYYPYSFNPQTAWRGYWWDGTPVVVLKLSAKTLGGWNRTQYALIWRKNSEITYSYYDSMPSKSKFKKVVKL